jgi:hypothetical protein
VKPTRVTNILRTLLVVHKSAIAAVAAISYTLNLSAIAAARAAAQQEGLPISEEKQTGNFFLEMKLGRKHLKR